MNIEERVARLEARVEIQELLVRYTLLIDDHDFDALGDLFTADARFGRPGSAHEGREAIVANYRAKGDQYPISLHVARGLVLDLVDDDHARGQVVGFSEQASSEHTVITAFRYDDHYRREEGRWRFAVRDVRTLYAHDARRAGRWWVVLGRAQPLAASRPERGGPAAGLIDPVRTTGAMPASRSDNRRQEAHHVSARRQLRPPRGPLGVR